MAYRSAICCCRSYAFHGCVLSLEESVVADMGIAVISWSFVPMGGNGGGGGDGWPNSCANSASKRSESKAHKFAKKPAQLDVWSRARSTGSSDWSFKAHRKHVGWHTSSVAKMSPGTGGGEGGLGGGEGGLGGGLGGGGGANGTGV
tara:strand:+ start:230 stop:667 length:438 start_codon:yes stop_codon:yes gene_type:complete